MEHNLLQSISSEASVPANDKSARKSPNASLGHRDNIQQRSSTRSTNNQGKLEINSDIVLMMDSNGSQIDPKLLYPIEGSSARKLYCPLIRDLDNLLEEPKFTVLPKVVVIHCGTNDLDHSDSKTVTDNLTRTVKNLSATLISSKIIVSAFMPRKDFHNKEIDNFNVELAKKLQLLPNIHLVDHCNLLNESASDTILVDKKHLSDSGVKLFSKNLKDCIFGRFNKQSKLRRTESPPRFRKYDFPENKDSPYMRKGNSKPYQSNNQNSRKDSRYHNNTGHRNFTEDQYHDFYHG